MSALLSTFGIDWHLLIAQTINFVLLAVILSWLLYKPVLRMVRERERVVAKGVEDAEEAQTRLSHADSLAASRVLEAEQTAADLVTHARKAASDERMKIVKEAETRAAEIAKDAEARAAESAARAKRESDKEIARLAVLAAEKVLRKEVTRS